MVCVLNLVKLKCSLLCMMWCVKFVWLCMDRVCLCSLLCMLN